MSVKKCIFSFWILIIGYTHLALSAVLSDPHIELDSEYTVHAGDNFNITCKSTQRPQWTYPRRSSTNSTSTITTSIELLPNDINYTYMATLIIRNASYLDTGYFYCHHADVDYAGGRHSNYTYLFVEDENHLTLDTDPYFVHLAETFTDVVLPCIPTSSNVHVRLQKSEENERHITFDTKAGFTISNVQFNDSGTYFCIFTRDPMDDDEEEHEEMITIILKVFSPRNSILRPTLIDQSDAHTVVGETLTLNCSSSHDIPFNFSWITPHSSTSRLTIKPEKTSYSGQYSLLTIESATMADGGIYKCEVKDYFNNTNAAILKVPVYGLNHYFLEINEDNNLTTIEEIARNPIVISVQINAHPIESLRMRWSANGKLITDWDYQSKHTNQYIGHNKYEANFDAESASLTILDARVSDIGDYVIEVSNQHNTTMRRFYVLVTDKPEVQLNIASVNYVNAEATIECVAKAYPFANITWQICVKTDGSEDCGLNEFVRNDIPNQVITTSKLHTISAKKPAVVTCIANNTEGTTKMVGYFNVTDVKNGFNLYTSDNFILDANSSKHRIPIGDTGVLYCQAAKYAYAKTFKWYFNDEEMVMDENLDIFYGETELSYKSTVKIQHPERGEYKCSVLRKSAGAKKQNKYQNATIIIEVAALQPPRIYQSNMDKELNVYLPATVNISCYFDGVPRPTIEWLKNNEPLALDNRTEFYHDKQMLILQRTMDGDEGIYSCLVKNKVGTVQRDVKVSFNNKAISPVLLSIIIIVLVILVFCVGGISCQQRHKGQLYKKQLKELGLESFKHGDIEKINPEIGLTEQANWLPYEENRWEFPFEKLKLGKQIGSGAFGVVLKGEAYGILAYEPRTIVAVKTIKHDADVMHLKALTSELKIMGQIGQNVNVVNLLGACTQNLVKRQLFVIVEFCRYGNLQSYLLKHRQHFVNQLVKDRDIFDFNIGVDDEERSMSFSSYRSNSQSSQTRSPSVSKMASFKPNVLRQVSEDMEDYRGPNYTGQSTRTESTLLPAYPEDTITSNNSSEGPGWRSNFRGDYNEDVQYVFTKDLVAWAFQVARGMEYLVKRRVLHRDLAARNILLAENNVVKICDFGLAKDAPDYEKKSGDTPLPIKWMAVESIQDKVFSTQSDVWSYGIVLWEFFSLAKSPYPGMVIDDSFLLKIINGFRMGIPKYATNEVYNIMTDCWNQDPILRPSFTDLVERMGKILGNVDKQHYVDLNDPYLVANTQIRETDYMAMMAPPDYSHMTSAPLYINDDVLAPSEVVLDVQNSRGYMCMKPGQIFSPRPPDYAGTNVFQYNTAGNGELESPTSEHAEVQPMLTAGARTSSDSGIPDASPSPLAVDCDNSVSNPSYQHFNFNLNHDYQNVNAPDNYININQSKQLAEQNVRKGRAQPDKSIVNSCTISGAVHDDLEIDEMPYVNSSTRDWDRITTGGPFVAR